MKSSIKWLQTHKFEANLFIFLMITIPSILLFFAMQTENQILIGVLLGLMVAGLLAFVVIALTEKNIEPIQDIDYYLVLSREDIGSLEVSKHNPGEIVYALCQEINRLREIMGVEHDT